MTRKRVEILALCAFVVLLAFAPRAAAQGGTSEFTLQPSPLSPNAMAPGGTASTSIQVDPAANSGFTGSVALSCQVTSTITTTDPPVCTVSPPSVTVPASATATITTKGTTTTTLYSVTITGTGPTTTYTTPALQLTVLAVSAQFTITIESAVAPSSVIAGSGAQGIVSVNPANGYSGNVTLACASITPLVTIPPVCSFAYPGGASSLPVPGTQTSTLTISTFGPVTTGARSQSRNFYALWMTVPFLGLVGLGAAASGKRSRKAWGLLAIFVLGGSFLLIPACSNSASTSTSTPNGTTPANTYTFTIVGVDQNGVVSSNASLTNAGPTVSLTVTAPKTH